MSTLTLETLTIENNEFMAIINSLKYKTDDEIFGNGNAINTLNASGSDDFRFDNFYQFIYCDLYGIKDHEQLLELYQQKDDCPTQIIFFSIMYEQLTHDENGTNQIIAEQLSKHKHKQMQIYSNLKIICGEIHDELRYGGGSPFSPFGLVLHNRLCILSRVLEQMEHKLT